MLLALANVANDQRFETLAEADQVIDLGRAHRQVGEDLLRVDAIEVDVTRQPTQ